MGTEIERKYLVDHKKWKVLNKPKGEHYRQGYILNDDQRVVRVRVTDSHAYITIKGPGESSISRKEYEYEIPITDGEELLASFTSNGTEKIRYRIPADRFTWEVDEFLGNNQGLIVAEIELSAEQDKFEIPTWITEEVTDDSRYANSSLAVHPFNKWK
jgi:adenylate cyclase